ncbi:MAG: diaminopropionate ammonia-lyase [Actinobacteria bacterium]|nr:diaminopropionate ammonia-lyase [Actinomycetota bacterium]
MLAGELGLGHVLIKDESSRLGLPSFKMLGASWAVYRALSAHLGVDFEPWSTIGELVEKLERFRPLTLVAATDGNHGRAVAHMARLLGLEARIFVPTGTAEARIDAIKQEGATCEVVDGGYDRAVARSAEEQGPRSLVISDTSWEGYESVPRWVTEGYSTMYWEIDDQTGRLGLDPDLVVVPIGVGALAAAAVRHYRREELEDQPAILGVEPIGAQCVLESVRVGHLVTLENPRPSIMAGLNCDTPSMIAWPVLSQGLSMLIAIDDEASCRAMRALARCSVVAGETGAAALGGLIELLGDAQRDQWLELFGLGAHSTVLVLCTEGATDQEAYARIVGKTPAEVAAGAKPEQRS